MLINKILNKLRGGVKFMYSPYKYAIKLGVIIKGTDVLIADRRHWPSEPYLITIENHTQITEGVKFLTHGGSHVLRNEYPDFDIFGKIVVKEWAYIGAKSMIMPGVTIGKGSLVAAGSVVTRSVPDYVVVAGVPARVMCTVSEYYEKNKKYNVGANTRNPSNKKEFLMSAPEEFFIKK